MKRIALDTTGRLLSCAAADGEARVDVSLDIGMAHAERIVPVIDHALATLGLPASELDYVACASGPGSFTGLRIAISTLKGIASALDIPLILVPTLDAYAHPHSCFEGAVVPLVDAKKGRVYAAVYSGGIRTGDFLDVPFSDLLAPLAAYERVLFTGIDAELAGQSEDPRFRVDPAEPRGHALSVMGIADGMFARGEFSANAEGPIYLRVSEAELGILTDGGNRHG